MCRHDSTKELREAIEREPGRGSISDLRAAIEEERSSAVGDLTATLLSVADDDPERARELLVGLSSLFEHENAVVRNATAQIIRNVAATRAEHAVALSSRLAERLADDSPMVRTTAAEALVEVAAEDPDAVTPAVDGLASCLDVDFPDLRTSATTLAVTIADEDPDTATALLDPLLDCAGRTLEPGLEGAGGSHQRDVPIQAVDVEEKALQGVDTNRERAARAVVRIADGRPDVIAGAADRIVELVTREISPQVRLSLIEALGIAAESHPDDLRSTIDPLASIVESTRFESLRARATWALGILAEAFPAEVVRAVEPRLPILFDLLEADDPQARGAAAGLLSYVAERDPDAVEPATDRVIALLDDEEWFVRVNAAWTLRSLGGDSVLAALREAAGDDPNPDVRGAIEDAIAQIERD